MSRARRSATTLRVHRDRFAIDGTFTIARGSRTVAEVLTVHLEAEDGRGGTVRGRGECMPYARYGESLDSVGTTIESLRGALADGLDRDALQDALPAGAARNAIDCALWDLEAKRRGVPVWQLAGLDAPAPVTTAYTLSLDVPAAMEEAAAAAAARPLLKIKLGGEGATDLARLEAVRRGAPAARLVVDANEGWSAADYAALSAPMLALGVALVEQPLPADDDRALGALERPLPVCADESCHDRATLAALAGRYDLVNIKLDKTGGLTEALATRAAARAAGFGIMVGCMVCSSLAMAPAGSGSAPVDGGPSRGERGVHRGVARRAASRGTRRRCLPSGERRRRRTPPRRPARGRRRARAPRAPASAGARAGGRFVPNSTSPRPLPPSCRRRDRRANRPAAVYQLPRLTPRPKLKRGPSAAPLPLAPQVQAVGAHQRPADRALRRRCPSRVPSSAPSTVTRRPSA